MNETNVLLKTLYSHAKLQDPKNAVEIKSFQNQLEKCRLEELQTLNKLVTEICSSLESLKLDVFHRANREFNIENLRTKMFELKDKILALKFSIKEELTKVLEDESTLLKDLQILKERMEDWAKPITSQILKPLKPSIYKIYKQSINNPANEFQKFILNSGGHCGGWLEHDHLLFLRERRKSKDKEKFLTAIKNFLPDLSYDDVLQHEAWYTKYELLKNAQKQAIQNWKTNKLVKQEQTVETKDSNNKKEAKSNKKTLHQIRIAERIKEWKKQQLNKKLEEIEKQKQEKKQIQKEREKLKEIQRVKKLAVSQYKAQKLSRIQAEKLLHEEKKYPEIDKAKRDILQKAFRLQDIKFVEKKKIIRLELESKNTSKVERLKLTKPPIDFILKRDPQRLFKPTLIWSQHCQQNEQKEKFNNSFNLNTIPHLAIPEWRRELK